MTFVDTNVLVYAHDASEQVKQPIARALLDELWLRREGIVSTQILQEFYNTVTRRLAQPMPRAEAREIVDAYTAWPVVGVDPTLILAATVVEEEHQLSFWDALVVEAARIGGAERIVSEDMSHGRVIAGVGVENPFHVEPSASAVEGEISGG